MTPHATPDVMWFREDLRLHDNPALLAAARDGRPVLAVYIWDCAHEAEYGAAHREYLRRSLHNLRSDLSKGGFRGLVQHGW